MGEQIVFVSMPGAGLAVRSMNESIDVLIIDDSAPTRDGLRAILEGAPGIRVVGAAADPLVARRLLDRITPDVITLDLLMPRMDGLTFLRKLMAGRPMPVVVVSTITQEDAELCLEALQVGAVGVVDKVTIPHPRLMKEFARELVDHVRAAASSRVGLRRGARRSPVTPINRPGAGLGEGLPVMIGASTGGTEAIQEILTRLPDNAPPIVAVQHMPMGFTKSFAARLDESTTLTVREASDGDRLRSGEVLIAPGHGHVEIAGTPRNPRIEIVDAPKVNHHRPSVDVLFHSAARIFGADSVGILLTGMGTDGADGLQAMASSGAMTIAQDAESCVVYGMPGAAARLGACKQILPLVEIPEALLIAASGRLAAAGRR
ncbi:MAG: chemotaxis response regulator protein-glutamate methylesterase [Nitrospirota bacterium]